MFLEVREGVTKNEERESTGHAQRGAETKLRKGKASKGGPLRGGGSQKDRENLPEDG